MENIFLQIDIADKDCLTIDTGNGGNVGAECIFPFVFRGVVYKKCTRVGDANNKLWCSTKVDDKGVHVNDEGYFGHCNPKCNKGE